MKKIVFALSLMCAFFLMMGCDWFGTTTTPTTTTTSTTVSTTGSTTTTSHVIQSTTTTTTDPTTPTTTTNPTTAPLTTTTITTTVAPTTTTTTTVPTTVTTTSVTTTVPVTYVVSFESNGGTSVTSQNLASGASVVEPTAPTRNLFDFAGWYADEGLTDPWVFESDHVSGTLTLYAKWTHQGTAISTPADLEAFILNSSANSGSGTWYLANDIDMTSITTLVGSTLVFSGIFDGQGYTIRNVVYTAGATKTGFLFKELASGSLVTDIRFEDSIITGIGESNAFLSAYAQAGAEMRNLEFINCSIISTGSYAALLFGDVYNDPATGTPTQITIRNITVINDVDHRIEGGSYTGGLVGSCRKPITIDLENIYFDSTVICPSTTSGQACGAIMGRHNGTPITLNVRNAVIKGAVTAGQKNGGVILGTSVNGSIVNVDHVFLDDLVLISGTTKIGTVVGNPVTTTTITATNITYNSETVLFQYGTATPYTPVTPDNAAAVAPSEVTESWFLASGFNQTFFAYGTTTIVPNGEEVGEAVENGLSVIVSGVNRNILKGGELDLSGLVVKATYSDGSSVALEASAYTIDTSAFVSGTVGTYTITVTYKTYEKTFDVNVIEVLYITADDLLMKTTYLLGGTLDYTNLAVKAILSDGSYLRLTPEDYTVNASAFNNAVEGTYAIQITYSTFESVSFNVYVCRTDTEILENTIKIYVDLDYSGVEGSLLAGMNNFSSMKNALAYVKALGLDAGVRKVFYIANGTYHEKIVVDIPNVMFIGENANSTILTYDAASGLESPTGGNWGTQGSASVAIKSSAVNFMAMNVTFANGFDYNGSSIADKQAVALVTEADKAIFHQCRFLGWQDTLYAKSGRQYYFECYIEGVVDFIFGNGGPAFFQSCIIHSLSRSTGCLTAQKGYNTSSAAILTYGYVFYQNEFTADATVPAGSVDLGRPWDKYAAVTYISNIFGSHISTRGWTEMSGYLPTDPNVRFCEYQNLFAGEIYGNGIDDDLNGSIDDFWPTSTNGVALTPENAALAQDKSVVFAQVNGAVDFGSVWDYATDLSLLQSKTYPA